MLTLWASAGGLLLLFIASIVWTVLRDKPGGSEPYAAHSYTLPGGSAEDAQQFAGIDMLTEAAEAGDQEAQYELAMRLLQKSIASRDLATRNSSLRWLREAAYQGFAPAQAELGDRYMNGRGVIQDFSQAAEWYLKAAEQGEASSMYSLGRMARSGRGVRESAVEAYVWLNVAAARGEERASEIRNQVISALSAEQLSDAQARARELDAEIPRLVADRTVR